MTEINIEQFFNDLPKYFLPEKAVGIDAVVQINLTGKKSGDWVLTIHNQKCRVEKGTVSNPLLSLTMDYAEFISIFRGELDPMRAFMMGKIRLKGNVALATRLTSMFNM